MKKKITFTKRYNNELFSFVSSKNNKEDFENRNNKNELMICDFTNEMHYSEKNKYYLKKKVLMD